MSNLHARAIAPEPTESRRMQEQPLQAARESSEKAAAEAEVYGNTFGLPFAVWWTIVLTILITIGWMLEVQLRR